MAFKNIHRIASLCYLFHSATVQNYKYILGDISTEVQITVQKAE